MLVKSQQLEQPIDLDELLCYSLTPVPPSLGTPDGFFNKTNKASILHYLIEDGDRNASYPKGALFIQDGNALFHMLNDIPQTFGDICLMMLDQMLPKRDFIFSTDSYNADSIKAQERSRRGSSPKYIIGGPSTRKPRDFKLFLTNGENKEQLCKLLLKVWGSEGAASRLSKCNFASLVVDGKVYKLTSSGKTVSIYLFFFFRKFHLLIKSIYLHNNA